jgi:alpha-D-glucose phosphate-specific phosphoglucomutase
MDIRFGTSGWRGIIAEDFTFENVRIVTQAIADYLKESGGKSIVVGYDTRFLSEDFASTAAKILAQNDLIVDLSQNDLPTPVIAYEIRDKHADGGVNFTASHNDYIYNGLKFSTKSGGPALTEETKRIEENIARIIASNGKLNFQTEEANANIRIFDKTTYPEELIKLIDFTPIKERQLSIVYEPFFGTGRRFTPNLLNDLTNFTMIHGNRDPLFEKMHPEPIESNLVDLRNEVLKQKADLGVSTDVDADRFGFIDNDGSFISPDMILPIIYYYLLAERKMKGNIVRTVATTHLLDRIADGFGFEAIETPVGFKYIGEALEKGEAIFGGEESGGASITGWLPEKDGMLVILLVTEIVSKTRKTLKGLFAEIAHKFGESYSARLDYPFYVDRIEVEKAILSHIAELKNENIVKNFDEIDGIRAIFNDESWMLFRFSGTEPKLRIYFEAKDNSALQKLKKLGEDIFKKATVGGNDVF